MNQVGELEAAESPEDIQSVLEELSTWGEDECVVALQDLAQQMLSNPEADWSSALSAYREEWQYFDPQGWGETTCGESMKMSRIDFQQISQF